MTFLTIKFYCLEKKSVNNKLFDIIVSFVNKNYDCISKSNNFNNTNSDNNSNYNSKHYNRHEMGHDISL